MPALATTSPSSPPTVPGPLAGKRVVVTRARAQADELSERLRLLGAEPVEVPAIRIVPPADDYAALDAAIARIERYDWIVLTSVNGVAHLWERLHAAGRAAAIPEGPRVAAIGSATAEAVEARGAQVALVPDTFVAESLLDALGTVGVAGQRFLLPRADIARAALREGLEAAGAIVDEVHAYRTVPGAPEPAALESLLDQQPEYLTFTSSSTVRNFVALVGTERARRMAQHTTVAAIGPITARTARGAGLEVRVVAVEYTMAGLVAALLAHALGDRFMVGAMSEAAAREIAGWRYEGPYAQYNPSADVAAELAYLTDPAQQIYALYLLDGTLAGYCSFGADGQVPGYPYPEEALDLGLHLRPTLAGQGHSAELFRAVLRFGQERYAPHAYRGTIASWNERALRAARRAGFAPVATFVNPEGIAFTVVQRDG